MRRLSVFLLAALLLCGCAGAEKAPAAPEPEDSAPPAEEETVELSLWTYPVGGWGSGSTVASLVSNFHREYPHIHVSIKILDYVNGDADVEDAIAQGQAPDLILEGPERLSANWGARGLMVDLSDLWQSETAGKIYPRVADACRSGDAYYIYPMCMTTHCMAINRAMFEESGAWEYVDEASHTWSTEDFIAAVKKLRASGVKDVAAVYCNGQGGDQGTRALVNNLYSGVFTDPEHSRYVFNSPENVRALELLTGLEGVKIAPELTGTDEQLKFCAGELAMTFCWNVAAEVNQTISNPDLNFDIFPMAFPTDDGVFDLQGGIWGFGIFENGDEARIEAAKTFIRFMNENEAQYTQAVLASTFWPVREMQDLYKNDKLMTEYSVFQQYLGDYYQVTPGWADARTAWWTMLQQLSAGTNAAKAAADFEAAANAAAGIE